MLQASVTKLETFRKYYEDAMHGYITKEKVIEAIKGETPWSAQMNIGTAYHAIVENGPEKYFNEKTGLFGVTFVEKDVSQTVLFNREEIQAAIKYREQHPNVLYEIPISHELNIKGVPFKISMRIDGMEGLYNHENKTKYKKAWSIKDYDDSVQWKIYCLATGAVKTFYNIFEIIGKKDEKNFGTVQWHQFSCLAQPDHEGYIKGLISLYLLFCESNDLMSYVDRNN